MELYLTEENYQSQVNDTVFPYLEARMEDGFFESFDGKKIHYRLYRADSPKGTVTIFHGFTESIEKFLPLIYVFLKEGYNAAMTDMRGHGHSYRDVEDLTITHIEYFEEYVLDQEVFTREFVSKLSGPHYLFAHSMGGGVGAMFLEKNHDFFDKAVLSSPMIEPAHKGIPIFIGQILIGFFTVIGKGNKKVWFFPEYTGIERFESCCANSEARFEYYYGMKKKDAFLTNKNPSYRWTLESLNVRKKLLKKGKPESIRIPVRIFAADQETLVTRDAQEAFIHRVPQGSLVEIKGTKHEIFRASDPVLKEYLESLFRFLED